MVQVLEPTTGEPEPASLTTQQASLEANEGKFVVVTGKVLQKIGSDTLIVNDGSGPVRVFLDGYNGSFTDILLNYKVRVVGLASEDGSGSRIRVRNYVMHPEFANDVTVLETPLYFPILMNGK
jgi:uncharacterized protein YdeI (BOF family)